MSNNKGVLNLELIDCSRCGGQMFKSLINYNKIYKNNKLTVPGVEGYVCSSCGYEYASEEHKDYVEQELRLKELQVTSNQDNKYILVNYLKRIREKRGFSQKELGEALGVKEQRYGVIERNSNTPTIYTEHLLALLLNVGPQDLYKMIPISNSLYEKIIDLEYIDWGDNSYTFKHVKEIADLRKQIQDKSNELIELNNEKRKYRNMKLEVKEELMTDSIREKIKARDKKIREIEEKIENVKIIKDGPKHNGKGGLTDKFKRLEGKHTMVIRQEKVIDADIWDRICIEFKDDLKDIK